MSAPVSEHNGFPPYVLVLTLECEEADAAAARMMRGWPHAAASPAVEQRPAYSFAAYKKHPGPEQKFYLLTPLQPAPEALEESDPAKESLARETLDTLTDALKTSTSLIATYVPELSHPPTVGIGPSPYVRLISAVLKPDLVADQTRLGREAAGKIVAAHQQSPQGRHFVTYHSYSGSDDVFHVAVPFNNHVELDDGVDNRELVQEIYGADEAARLLGAINQVVVKTASCIAEYHPFISAIV